MGHTVRLVHGATAFDDEFGNGAFIGERCHITHELKFQGIRMNQTKRLLNRGHLGFLAGAFFTVMSGGCAMQLPNYPVKQVAELPPSSTEQGVQAAVHGVSDWSELNTYFGADLGSGGVLPILVVIENKSERSVLVDPGQFQMENPTGKVDMAVKGGISNKTPGECVALTAAALGSFPGLFLGMKMISDAETVKHNFEAKELRRQTVSPGGAVQGFVFYKFGENRQAITKEQWQLDIKLTVLSSGEAVLIPVKLSIPK